MTSARDLAIDVRQALSASSSKRKYSAGAPLKVDPRIRIGIDICWTKTSMESRNPKVAEKMSRSERDLGSAPPDGTQPSVGRVACFSFRIAGLAPGYVGGIRLEIGGWVAYIRFNESHEDRRLFPVRQARAPVPLRSLLLYLRGIRTGETRHGRPVLLCRMHASV